jgi:hypothetical protein
MIDRMPRAYFTLIITTPCLGTVAVKVPLNRLAVVSLARDTLEPFKP